MTEDQKTRAMLWMCGVTGVLVVIGIVVEIIMFRS